MKEKIGYGTLPVYLSAITTILGAILFLRFGYAVGTIGFLGALLILFFGHLVTIPAALSLSELASNQRVEGGGEYFIISRTFGLNVGSTIGVFLYLSQAISIAFFVVAFTEAFEPFFTLINGWSINALGFEFPRHIISIPAMIGLSALIQRKGTKVSLKMLYIVVGILAIALFLFFIGDTGFEPESGAGLLSFQGGNIKHNFFIVFAIVFPAFAGMTAGVGLSGELKSPARSIPLGITLASVTGLVVYFLVAFKLANSASMDDLSTDYYIMNKIAVFGPVIIPLALAASTISSAINAMIVAPKTLQALGSDNSIPIKRLNKYAAQLKGKNQEPVNATLLTSILAMCFVVAGDIDYLARIISMLFMLTYGSICLISFFNHFGANPSYRPVFRSRWYVSLTGFLFCLIIMLWTDLAYANGVILALVILYFVNTNKYKDRGGVQDVFKSAVFQLSRKLQLFIQKNARNSQDEKWRPSIVCISKNSFQNNKVKSLLEWVSFKYGFGTYIHLIEDYFSQASGEKAREIKKNLQEAAKGKSNIYFDTLVSPSFTSAIAQIAQLPGISGMPNNMLLLEYDKNSKDNLYQIAENIPLMRAAKLDIAILAASNRKINFSKGIHVWITESDYENSNLMILLSYIIIAHTDWASSRIKIFEIAPFGKMQEYKDELTDIINTGRLPISVSNIEIIEANVDLDITGIICEKSAEAGLTLIGFQEDRLKQSFIEQFECYDTLGDILFVNASRQYPIG
jgi:amino acid transporter